MPAMLSILPLLVVLGAEPVDSPRISQLIAQLGSDEFAEREEASRALDAIGLPALASFRQAQTSSDSEIARRASELVQRLEIRADTTLVLKTARRFHLVYKDTPLAQAIADFNQKTGSQLLCQLDDAKLTRRITLDTGDVTFWEALDQLCQAAGLVEQSLLPREKALTQLATGDAAVERELRQLLQRRAVMLQQLEDGRLDLGRTHDGRFALVEAKLPPVPTAHVGILRIRALPPELLVTGPLVSEEEKVLGLEITPEPGCHWLGVVRVQITRATDDRGRLLKKSFGYIGSAEPATDEIWMDTVLTADGGYVGIEDPVASPWQVPLRVRLGKDPARGLKELQGVVVAQVRTPPVPVVVVDDVLHATGKTFHGRDGGSIKVLAIQQEKDGRIHVRALVEPPPETPEVGQAANRFGLNRRLIKQIEAKELIVADPTHGLQLLDEKGSPYQFGEFSKPGEGQGDEREVTLVFMPQQGQGAPAQLVLLGERIAVIEVPFTLKDVPCVGR